MQPYRCGVEHSWVWGSSYGSISIGLGGHLDGGGPGYLEFEYWSCRAFCEGF
jgi:hypothetical protein